MANFEKKLTIPPGVTIKLVDNFYNISGSKGNINYKLHKDLFIKIFSDYLTISFEQKNFKKKEISKMLSLINTNYIILKNHFNGVLNFYTCSLILVGIGYKAKYELNSHIMSLYLGFSHSIEVKIPEEIFIEIIDNVNIIIKGVSKQIVGQTALNIKNKKIVDSYKGNGIRYKDDIVILKTPKKTK